MARGRAELDRIVQRLCRLTGQPYELDYMLEGFRFGYSNRYISPRLKRREMLLWLTAFEDGLVQSGVEAMRAALAAAPILPDDAIAAATPRTAADMQQWGATYQEWYAKDRARAVGSIT